MRLRFLILTCGLFAGCTRDPGVDSPIPPGTSARGVFILNEGQWGQGNASLSYYDIDSGRVTNDVFSAVNHRPLGDVGNAFAIGGGMLCIVVNNSNTIELVDLTDYHSLGTIDMGAGRSPRQMAFINDSIALVTNLYDDSVIPVNIRSRLQAGRIPVGANPDGIAVAAGKAFVANSGSGAGRSVSVIAVPALAVTDTVTVGDNPVKIHVSSQGEVYVLCAGSYTPDTPAGLYVINPQSLAVVGTIPLDGHVFEFTLAADGHGYVPVGDSVLIIDTGSRTITGTFVRGTAYYSIAVEPASGDVYAGNAGNFVQPGTVTIFSQSGVLRKTFTVGVIPGSFAFR